MAKRFLGRKSTSSESSSTAPPPKLIIRRKGGRLMSVIPSGQKPEETGTGTCKIPLLITTRIQYLTSRILMIALYNFRFKFRTSCITMFPR